MNNSSATDDSDRFETLRAHGRKISGAIEDLARDVGLEDPLDALAFTAGTLRDLDPKTGRQTPFSTRFHEAKRAARDAGATWPEIAEAIGEGGDRVAGQRVRARFVENERRLKQMRAGGE